MSKRRPRLRRAAGRCRRSSLLVERMEDRYLLAPFTVTNLNDDGAGSLRQAILDANASVDAFDTIGFNIAGLGPHVISPGSALPTVGGAVGINGTDQDALGGPIVIDGAGAGADVDGLTIAAGNSSVTALTFRRFSGAGIVVLGANNTIGGATAALRNILSLNGDDGILISGAGAAGNRVLGNFIGTDATGLVAAGNARHGITILGAANNTIGGTVPGARNVISGNSGHGVIVSDAGASGNVIAGNFVGTNLTGILGLGNGLDGVAIAGASGNFVGGTAAGAGNVIAGNQANGVELNGPGASNNLVAANAIGTDVTGLIAVGNSNGVAITGASSNTIGGTVAAARNVIAGNAQNGVVVTNTGPSGASGNAIAGNLIGVNSAGILGLGNGIDGVVITGPAGVGVANNTVGGTTGPARNVISGNAQHGVEITGQGASNNRVVGNFIGTAQDGSTALGNTGDGVRIADARDNTIGGTGTGSGNTISANSIGVAVTGNGASGNSIRRNSIFANRGVGIDLGADGPTPNDADDPDAGPNGLLNFPVLTSVADDDGDTRIRGSYNGLPNRDFVIEFFANASPDATGFGEGQRFLGQALVTTGGGGNRSFDVTLPAPVTPEEVVTATATDVDNDGDGSTSEFSRAAAGRADLNLTVADAPDPVEVGQDLSYTLTVRNDGPSTATGVTLVDTLPGSVTFASASGASFTVDSGVVTFSLPDLAVGQSRTVTIVARPTLEGPITNRATATGDQSDPQPGDNTNIQTQTTVQNVSDLNFEFANYAFREDAGTASIFVTRSGSTTTTVSVDYEITAASTATLGVDYTAVASGTLTFGPVAGNPPVQRLAIPITLLRDLEEDRDETVIFRLRNPQPSASADLGSQATTTVTIVDVTSYTVTTTADTLDLTDGVSLRAAITQANRNPGVNTIDFQIPDPDPGDADPNPPRVITLEGPLPEITGPVVIDGYTQPPPGRQNSIEGNNANLLIVLDGGDPDAAGDGLRLTQGASGSTVRGLVIRNFSGRGISLQDSSDNRIEGNFIGTNVAGTAAQPNGGDGIALAGASTNNIIGGASLAARNVISGNRGHGVAIIGAGATGNQVLGNRIGTNAAGTDGVHNDGHGVFLDRATDNTVGGASGSARNLISGNLLDGIRIVGDASGGRDNRVQGNYIGTDLFGTVPVDATRRRDLGNGQAGVAVVASPDNLIGGLDALARNVISNNGAQGVLVSGASATGNRLQGNFIGLTAAGGAAAGGAAPGNLSDGVRIDGSPDNTIGGRSPESRNVISGNGGHGVLISGAAADRAVVQNNAIGTNFAASAALGNAGDGVRIVAASNITIGGSGDAARNVIAGNRGNGITIAGGAADNRVSGNYIGINTEGSAPLGNGDPAVVGTGYGVLLDGVSGNTVGGTTAGERNVISGNRNDGVRIAGAGASGNLLRGNYIGTDANGATTTAGALRLGNARDGVLVLGAADNTIGGTTPGAGNVIAGNLRDGVEVTGAGASRTLIAGNFIGTDASGSAALGNGDPAVAGTGYGVLLDDRPGNTIGGTTAGAGNVISGNLNDGVSIAGANASGNLVQGNFIGTSATGTDDLGNAGDGVALLGGAPNTVGGTTAGAGNVISGNSAHGIEVTGPGASGTLIAGNSIGTNVDGSAALGNGDPAVAGTGDGVRLDGVSGITIGGATALARNLISGNLNDGIRITGPGTTTIRVQGNFIGTDADGDDALGNGGEGVEINGAAGNTIGGATAGERNVISGNTLSGVRVRGNGATGNVIQGNYIGTTADGSLARGNSGDGVLIDAPGDPGGAATGGVPLTTVSSNVISGNRQSGIAVRASGSTRVLVQGNLIGTDAEGLRDRGNTLDGVSLIGVADNTIGGETPEARNVISSNNRHGVLIQDAGASGNLILGNVIGLDAPGLLPRGNANDGVLINVPGDPGDAAAGGAPRNTVSSNVISSNGLHGIQVRVPDGTPGPEARTRVLVQGNLIGTDAEGLRDRGNALDGVFLDGVADNTIGGTAAGGGNVVAGNARDGIRISGTDARRTLVLGNFVGLGRDGTQDLGNTGEGVHIIGAPGTTIGGAAVGARNIISRNRSNGIRILGGGATESLVQGNRIGTDAGGILNLGNTLAGVSITGASGTTVGGAAAGAGNLISANGSHGIAASNAAGILIQGNSIGTDATGSLPLGNIGDGVNVAGSSGILIGGTTPGAGNVISANLADGIDVSGSPSLLVQGNFIGGDDTAADGSIPLGNTGVGVRVANTSRVTIGGPAAGAGNTIGGNRARGVEVSDDDTPPDLGDTLLVQGNVISNSGLDGVTVDGLIAVEVLGDTITGSGGHGVQVIGSGATETLLLQDSTIADNARDGVTAEDLVAVQVRNVAITGSGGNGVAIVGRGRTSTLLVRDSTVTGSGGDGVTAANLSGAQVLGNTISTNTGTGVRLAGVVQGTIGGEDAGVGNVIRGNLSHGIEVVDDPAVGGADPDDTLLVQGVSVADSGRDGLRVENISSVQVLDTTFTSSLARGIEVISAGAAGTLLVQGVSVTNSGGEGLTAAGLADARVLGVTITGSGGHGVQVLGSGGAGTLLVQDGIVAGGGGDGVTASALTDVRVLGVVIDSNSGVGVRIADAPRSLIGGPADALANTIRGNRSHGVELTRASDSVVRDNVITASGLDGVRVLDSSRVQILGNRIGDDGAPGRGNIGDGVFLSNAPGAAVGADGAGNVIVGSGAHGIEVRAGSDGVLVQGNQIGVTTDDGRTFVRGNAGDGVRVANSRGVTIGGTAAGARNVISGNLGNGIQLLGGATGVLVQGNGIGTDVGGTGVLDAQGQPLGNNLDGVLILDVANNTIGGTTPAARNVVVNNRTNGIEVSGRGASRNLVQGNSIGTDRDGTRGLGNAVHGVFLQNAGDNTIGGADAPARNFISGNGASGVAIAGPETPENNPAAANLVQGNFIGVDGTGLAALGNLGDGVTINNAPRNTIEANVISANSNRGLLISGGAATANVVRGNRIGTDAGAVLDLGNRGDGVTLIGTSSTRVLSNVISGNNGQGVLVSRGNGTLVQGNVIGTDGSGNARLGNDNAGVVLDNTRGATIGGNVIAANLAHGVLIFGLEGTGNRVQGNSIGTNAAGSNALGNAQDGVLLFETTGNTVGGTSGEARNVIAGNLANGVEVAGPNAGNNVIQGNSIGTDAAGALDLGNAANGVAIVDARDNAIGANLISANRSNGVLIRDARASGNQVFGNRIGLDRPGAGALGNVGHGVLLFDAPANAIRSNVIAGNGAHGVRVDGPGGGNQVQGNFIGTNVGGADDLGNALDGINVSNSPGTIIGGGASPLGNVIRFNRQDGIELFGPATVAATVQGNSIGQNQADGVRVVDAQSNLFDGTVNRLLGNQILGNRADGVRVVNATGQAIGGASGDARNVISGNAGAGVELVGGTTSAVVQGNFIGTDDSGGTAAGNAIGVFINDAVGNTVGGAALNVISGNRDSGVRISRADRNGPGNVVQGNRIGTDASGSSAVANGVGVLIDNAPDNIVVGNVISGNDTAGVRIASGRSVRNVVTNNRIGVAAGTDQVITTIPGVPFFNDARNRDVRQDVGVLIEDAPNNTVGGANLIAGNVNGIEVSGPIARDTTIVGNRIGLATPGRDGALGNFIGVLIDGTANNRIGIGDVAGGGNTIAGNAFIGVSLINGATGNLVQGNTIRANRVVVEVRDANGSTRSVPIGIGVFINGSRGNTIGAFASRRGRRGSPTTPVGTPGQGNEISENRVVGLYIFGGSDANAARRNRIANNDEYGVFVYNSGANVDDIARGGPDRNVIRGSRIATFREFTGPVVPDPLLPLQNTPRPRRPRTRTGR